ncbi:tetratricopeptide repeat protein [Mucilaginibacter angelicae]|uniref:Tetratricopeptide repeat protein n=1 Tax=Mucilaginibacter angelicae TaxID=869718 RepID=A0ABV6L4C4_9SPHI
MKNLIITLLLTLSVLRIHAQQAANDSLLLDYYQNQRFADAADYLKKAYPEPVTDLKVLAKLAYTSKMASRLPDAESYYQRIYATDTTSLTNLYNMSEIIKRRGNNKKALMYVKKILLKDTTNFDVYKQLADLSQNVGDLPGSIVYLQKANHINPLNPDVAYDLSSFYINLKLYDNAENVIDKALIADTANLLLLKGKAQTSYALKKYPVTIAITKKLMDAGEQAGSIVSMLATSYYMTASYPDCIKTFKTLEDGGTGTEASFYYTAMSYKALHNNTKAIAYLDKAIEEAISTGVSSYYSEKGDSYDRLHQLKSAVEAYQKSLLYKPDPITYYALATLYDTELKNKATALKYYKKYLASKPKDTQKAYITYSKERIKSLGV